MRLPFLFSALVAASLLCATAAHAQRPGGGGPGGGGPGGPGGGGPPGGGMGGPAPGISSTFPSSGGSFPRNNAPSAPGGSPQQSTMHTGLQLGPPGRWWDDKHYVKSLHLRSEQQKRMDAIFNENKNTLVARFEALQQEEAKMETLAHATTLDESALFSQIDRVSQARADLEKANTHYMLQVRKEMDPDQISRLNREQ